MSEALEGVPAMPVEVAKPRDAALAIPWRRGAKGVEVFWVKREKTLRFGGGFYTFPGGKVDRADGAIPVAGAGALEPKCRSRSPRRGGSVRDPDARAHEPLGSNCRAGRGGGRLPPGDARDARRLEGDASG